MGGTMRNDPIPDKPRIYESGDSVTFLGPDRLWRRLWRWMTRQPQRLVEHGGFVDHVDRKGVVHVVDLGILPTSQEGSRDP